MTDGEPGKRGDGATLLQALRVLMKSGHGPTKEPSMSNPNPLPQERAPIRVPGAGRTAGPESAVVRSIQLVQAWGREGVGLVRRQSQLFAAVFAGSLLVLGLAIVLQTPKFESTALVLVKVGRELIYTPEIGDQPSSVSSRDKQTIINSEVAIMRSEPVITGVVTSVGLEKLYPELAEQLTASEEGADPQAVSSMVNSIAAERLREELVVLALPEADVLQVSFRHPDAEVSQNAVDALIDEFTEAHLVAYGEPQIVRFLEERVEAYRQSLDRAEGELREFEVAHPVFALESPQAALTERLVELRSQSDAIDAQMTSVRLSALGEDGALAEAQRERLALEVEASKVKGHLREDADRRIGVVKEFISARKGEVNAQVAALQRKKDELQKELAKMEEERVQLPALSSAYRQLRRERDAHEEQYNTYQKRLRDARLSHEMDAEKIASISVIQQATLAPAPIWPLPPAFAVFAVLILSTVLAGLAATFADQYGWTWRPQRPSVAPVKDLWVRVANQARRR